MCDVCLRVGVGVAGVWTVWVWKVGVLVGYVCVLNRYQLEIAVGIILRYGWMVRGSGTQKRGRREERWGKGRGRRMEKDEGGWGEGRE